MQMVFGKLRPAKVPCQALTETPTGTFGNQIALVRV
jgi:hypothetical protein